MVNKILIILSIILLILAFWVGRTTAPKTNIPSNKEDVKKYQDTILTLKEAYKDLALTDSALTAENKTLKLKIANPSANIPQIDSSIAKDSANTISLFRKQLNILGYVTNINPSLTYREIGLGTKILSTVPGLRLQIKYDQDLTNNYDSLLQVKNLEIENLKEINLHQLSLSILNNESLTYYKNEYESTQSFFYQFPLKSMLLVVGIVVGFLLHATL